MGENENRSGAPIERRFFMCYCPYLNEIDEDEYHAILQKLLAAKRKSVHAESEYELNGKLVRFALSRGFEMKDICRCIDFLMKMTNSNENYRLSFFILVLLSVFLRHIYHIVSLVMKTLERLFAEKLLKIKAIKLQPANPFTWASGWKSSVLL